MFSVSFTQSARGHQCALSDITIIKGENDSSDVMCWLHADRNVYHVTEGFKADSLTFLLIVTKMSGCQIIIRINNVSL